MSYATVTAAVKTIIIAGGLTGFDAEDVSVDGDWTLLNGSHKFIGIIDYVGFDRERMSLDGNWLHTWHLVVVVGIQYKNDVQVHDDLRDVRDEVINEISKNPGLGISVYDAACVGGEDIPEQIQVGAGRPWSLEALRIDVTEQTEFVEVD